MYKTTGILSEREFRARLKQGDFSPDTIYQEYLEMIEQQRAIAAANRAALHPLDREVLERHEARRRREAERRAA